MRYLLTAFLLLLLLTVGCSDKPEPVESREFPDVKNVILIGIDTLRAKQLGFMGYDRPTSPFLDEFSRKCVIFDRAYTHKALTLASFTTLLSGLHVISHTVNGNGIILPPDLHMLTEDFTATGFRTLGFPASEVISKKYGIDKGFAYYSDISGTPGAQITGARVNEAVGRFLDGKPAKGELSFPESDEPLFLFIHYFDTHTPYTPPKSILSRFADPNYDGPFDGGHDVVREYNHYELELDNADLKHCRDMYDAEIIVLDNYLEKLFGMLEETGLMDNSILIFTADHGENLGEHHAITHGHPYEDALHIPLMFHFPGDWGAGKRIDSMVALTDALPTAMDIANVPYPEDIDGHSLLPLMQEEEVPYRERNYILSLGGANDEEKQTYSIVDGTYRLTKDIRWSETSILYNIIDDPHESFEIGTDNPELVKLLESIIVVMADRLKPVDGIEPGEQEMDAETEEILRSLGYIQ